MSHRCYRVALALACLSAGTIHAQVPHWDTADTLWSDSTLHHALAHGKLAGHFRLFAMGTLNDGALPDHHATAFGGTLGYRSARWHGFRFNLAGGYTIPITASELWQADDPALQPGRYELGLFDIGGHKQAEYLYMHAFNMDFRTRDRRWQFTLGKQPVDGPFLNRQDSRMHPTLFDGLTAQHHTPKGARYEVVWIHHMAPRATLHWVTAARSIGMYPGQGRDVHGRPSAYAGQLRSAGVFSALAEWKLMPKVKLSLHDLFVEGIFNTAFLQLDHATQGPWHMHLRAIRQDAMGHGGHPMDSLAYLPRGAVSHTLSGRMEYVDKAWTVRLNATRITADGRFLMPREWGREPLYTYMSRERNEGAGDVWAGSTNVVHTPPRFKGLRTAIGGGYYGLASPEDPRLNKYNMVSYGHAVLDLRYTFHGLLNGLDLRVLYVYKWPLDRSLALSDAQVYNRVDMHHVSIVMDHRF